MHVHELSRPPQGSEVDAACEERLPPAAGPACYAHSAGCLPRWHLGSFFKPIKQLLQITSRSLSNTQEQAQLQDGLTRAGSSDSHALSNKGPSACTLTAPLSGDAPAAAPAKVQKAACASPTITPPAGFKSTNHIRTGATAACPPALACLDSCGILGPGSTAVAAALAAASVCLPAPPPAPTSSDRDQCMAGKDPERSSGSTPQTLVSLQPLPSVFQQSQATPAGKAIAGSSIWDPGQIPLQSGPLDSACVSSMHAGMGAGGDGMGAGGDGMDVIWLDVPLAQSASTQHARQWRQQQRILSHRSSSSTAADGQSTWPAACLQSNRQPGERITQPASYEEVAAVLDTCLIEEDEPGDAVAAGSDRPASMPSSSGCQRGFRSSILSHGPGLQQHGFAAGHSLMQLMCRCCGLPAGLCPRLQLQHGHWERPGGPAAAQLSPSGSRAYIWLKARGVAGRPPAPSSKSSRRRPGSSRLSVSSSNSLSRVPTQGSLSANSQGHDEHESMAAALDAAIAAAEAPASLASCLSPPWSAGCTSGPLTRPVVHTCAAASAGSTACLVASSLGVDYEALEALPGPAGRPRASAAPSASDSLLSTTQVAAGLSRAGHHVSRTSGDPGAPLMAIPTAPGTKILESAGANPSQAAVAAAAAGVPTGIITTKRAFEVVTPTTQQQLPTGRSFTTSSTASGLGRSASDLTATLRGPKGAELLLGLAQAASADDLAPHLKPACSLQQRQQHS